MQFPIGTSKKTIVICDCGCAVTIYRYREHLGTDLHKRKLLAHDYHRCKCGITYIPSKHAKWDHEHTKIHIKILCRMSDPKLVIHTSDLLSK